MKDRIFLLVALMASVALVAAGCGDDDDNGNEGGTGGTISGEGGTGGETGEGGTGGETGEGGTGGETGSLTCDNFAPCGGSPSGTFHMVETCVAESGEIGIYDDPACIALPYTADIEMTGSISYTATKETWNLSQSGVEQVVITEACMQVLMTDLGLNCLDAAMELDCSDYDVDGGDCICTWDGTGDLTGTFDYEVVGNILTYPGYSDEVPFCIDGDVMGQDWNSIVLILEK